MLRPIVLTALVLVILGVAYYYFDCRIRDNDAVDGFNLESFGNGVRKMLGTIETFDSDDNLIKNGNFAGGKQISNADTVYNKMGNGMDIVQADNGGTGQYYLNISQGTAGYRIQVNLEAGTYYRLEAMWKGNVDSGDNLYNIVMPTDSMRDTLLTCNGNAGQTRGDWTEMVYIFKTPDNLKKDGVVDIYLTYKPTVVRGVTDVSLTETVPNSGNIPVSDGLQSFVSGTKFNGNQWVLSGGDKKLIWSKKPSVSGDAFLTTGNSLVGVASDNLFPDRNFTVMLYSQGVSGSDGRGSAVVIGGGQGSSAIVLSLPNGNGDVQYYLDGDDSGATNLGTTGVTGSGEHVYAFRYNTSGSLLNVFVDGVSLVGVGQGVTVKNLYFNSDKFKINGDGNWDTELYSVAVYSSALSDDDIASMGDYMVSNKGRTVDGDNGSGDVANSLLMCTGGNTTNNAFLMDMDGNAALNFNNDNDPDNSAAMYDTMDKNKLLEMCTMEADMNPTGSNEACQAYDRRFGGGYDCERSDFCPPAYFKNGKFWVYIPKKSYWAKKYGYWGARSYSADIDNARAVYQANFPECRVPDVLRKEKYSGDMSKCPFVINKDNPCNDYACKDVDWTDPAHMSADIDNKCRVSVGKYCNNHWDKDESCSCWNPDNYEKAACKEYRKQFSGIDWSLFDINDFNLYDHKDFKKITDRVYSTVWSGGGAPERKY